MLSLLTIATVALSASTHQHKHATTGLAKRSNDCLFPTDLGLVAVNKDGAGGGWAISMDQTCKAGSWCPYACPPGYLSMQWDPEATSYSYPELMYGGLKCNSDGTLSKGFSDRPYCVKGKQTISAKNTVGSDVAFCQTVLPGNEEMLIPTNVEANGEAILAVPGTDYWASTAAHYYINSPGILTSDACTWGSDSKAQGNWAPYVAGANQDDSGNTFVKLGWNPIYLDSSFANEKPNFGVRITCDDESKCNGLQCEIDPSQGVNSIKGSSSSGAGNGDFCVVTVEKGLLAKIEIFSAGSSGSSKTVKSILNRAANITANSTISSTASPSATSNSASGLKVSLAVFAVGLLGFLFA